MKVLITGGAGFIGSRLARALRDRAGVTILDVTAPSLDACRVVRGSVLDPDAVAEAAKGVDVVVHLAGLVRESMHALPTEGTLLQVGGTRNILAACGQAGIPRAILASSFYVYAGNVGEDVVTEGSVPRIERLDAFGRAKLASESLCRQASAAGGPSYTILRFGSAYGPGGSNAVGAFIAASIRGDPIELWGQGQRRNQYTYVEDIVAGIVSVLEEPDRGRDQVFDLISPEVTTTAELAFILRDELRCQVRFVPDRAEGASLPYMSSAKAAAVLGWSTTPLAAGLRRVITEMGGRLTAGPA